MYCLSYDPQGEVLCSGLFNLNVCIRNIGFIVCHAQSLHMLQFNLFLFRLLYFPFYYNHYTYLPGGNCKNLTGLKEYNNTIPSLGTRLDVLWGTVGL